eukprot:gene8611-558_t
MKFMLSLLLSLVINCIHSNTCYLESWYSNIYSSNFYNNFDVNSGTYKITQKRTNDFYENYFINAAYVMDGEGDGSIQGIVSKMDISFYTHSQNEQYAGFVVEVQGVEYNNISACIIDFKGNGIISAHGQQKLVKQFSKSFFDSSYWVHLEKKNEKIRCGFSMDKKTWFYSNFEKISVRTSKSFQFGMTYSNNLVHEGEAQISDMEVRGFGYCNNNGVCKKLNSVDSCICDNEWTGDRCEYFTCFGLKTTDSNVCSKNGKCIAHNTCQCFDNSTFNGPQCEKTAPFEQRECVKQFDFSIPFVSGYNYNFSLTGEIDDSPSQISTPMELKNDQISKVYAGVNHVLVILLNGTICSYGSSEYGQLGHGDSDYQIQMKCIPSLTASGASSGYYHNLIQLSNGEIVGFGHNLYGQLGVSDKINRFSPTEIIKIPGMIHVSAGGYHSIFLRNNGKIYVCGRNNYGQLGLGSTIDYDYPTELIIFSDAKSVSAGAYHSSFVTKTGDIYTTGRNQMGQLGIKKISSHQTSFQILFSLGEVDEMILGEHHSIALKKGDLYGFGDNLYSQIGLKNVSFAHTPTKIVGISKIKKISSMGFHNLALNEDGTIIVFGRNDFGQLGIGNASFSEIPKYLSNAKENFHFSSGHALKSFFIPDCPSNSIFCATEAKRNFTFIECNNGFTGQKCEIHSCFDKNYNDNSVCSGKGNCLCLNNCSCIDGYYGNECQNFDCFLKNNSDPNTCSGHGRCYSPNKCDCKPGYFGDNCESTFRCFGFNSTDSNTCSGNGICTRSDKCECFTPYSGSKCERKYFCIEDEYNTTNVCLSRGNCIGDNICRCDTPFIGDICQDIGCGTCNFGSCSDNKCFCPPNRYWDGDDCVCTFFYIGLECKDLSIGGIIITIISCLIGLFLIGFLFCALAMGLVGYFLISKDFRTRS